ncbi:hypothetical protein R3P38DRAFT_2805784 [Favolaschia claudopus]|uniref:Uncharacterized protein n=1 Tax=Favolaschia claudopus TaxID=2862362 RepID=A0AAV9ZMJ9_9AGAR
MPILTLDPNLETCPDFTLDSHRNLRSQLAQGLSISEDEAAQKMAASWNLDHQARKDIWATQLLEEQQTREEANRQAREEQERLRLEKEKEDEAEKKEAEKKKPKLPVFDANARAPSILSPRPSPFAKKKVSAYEYIELWYFTYAGCMDAAKSNRGVASDDTFGITRADDVLALAPVSVSKPSDKVILDENLTWSEMSAAKTLLVKEMETAKWPKDYVMALAQFFYNLDNHVMRHEPHGEKTLLLFQARVRREWHDQLKLGTFFNIANINEDLLRTVRHELLDRMQLDKFDTV